MKLLITGIDESGRSVFESESALEPVAASMAPDLVNYPIFSTLTASQMLDPESGQVDDMTFFPPSGALRAFQLEIGPPRDVAPVAPTAEQLAEGERLFPGLFQMMEVANPGMHTTDTVDFVVVLEGEVILELDDGQERTLHPNDVVIQRGTRHRWRNETDKPLRLSVVMLGLDRA